MSDAKALIAALGLEPHPEGGWYRETWRADAAEGERASATLIYFLLEAGQTSHWHRVDAAEIWLWHAGNPLQLSLSSATRPEVHCVRLGADIAGGQVPHHVIAPGDWQAARPLDGVYDFTLVSCAVSPGFEFSGFTLAPPGWHPGA